MGLAAEKFEALLLKKRGKVYFFRTSNPQAMADLLVGQVFVARKNGKNRLGFRMIKQSQNTFAARLIRVYDPSFVNASKERFRLIYKKQKIATGFEGFDSFQDSEENEQKSLEEEDLSRGLVGSSRDFSVGYLDASKNLFLSVSPRLWKRLYLDFGVSPASVADATLFLSQLDLQYRFTIGAVLLSPVLGVRRPIAIGGGEDLKQKEEALLRYGASLQFPPLSPFRLRVDANIVDDESEMLWAISFSL